MSLRMVSLWIVGALLVATTLKADPPESEPTPAKAVLFEVKVYEVDHSQLPSNGDSQKVQAAFDDLLRPWLDGWRGSKLEKGNVTAWATKGAVSASEVEKRKDTVRLVAEPKLMVPDGESGSFDYGGKTPQIEIYERNQGSSRTTPLAGTFALESAVTDSGRVFVSVFFDKHGSPRKKRSTVEELKQDGVKVNSELSVGQTLCLSDARFNSNHTNDSLLVTITPVEIKTLEEEQRIRAVAAKPAKPKELEFTIEDRWPIGEIRVGQQVVLVPTTIEQNRIVADTRYLSFLGHEPMFPKVTRIEPLPSQAGRRVTMSLPDFDAKEDSIELYRKLQTELFEHLKTSSTTFVVPVSNIGLSDIYGSRLVQNLCDQIPTEHRPRPIEVTVGDKFMAVGVMNLLGKDHKVGDVVEYGSFSMHLQDDDCGGFWRATATKPGLTRLVEFQIADDHFGVARISDYLVKADTRELELHIRQQFPSAKVAITSIGANAVMLKGTVASDEDATGIVELAEQFAPKVLNRLKVGAATTSDDRTPSAKIEIQSVGGRTKVTASGSPEEVERAIDSAKNSLPVITRLRHAALENADDVTYQPAPDSAGEQGSVSPPVKRDRANDRGADAAPLAKSAIAEPQRVRPRKAAREVPSKSAELQQLRDEIRELRQDVRELIQRLDREQARMPPQNDDAKPANAEAHRRLIGDSVSKLLKRACEASEAPVTGKISDVKKRICFIGVANGTDNEIGELKVEIYEQIDAAISEAQAYQPVSRRYVEAALKQLRLRPNELLLKEDQRNFQAVMEEMNQPFDEVLVATLTADTTEQSNELQRDYVLTLELLNIHNGVPLKETAKLRNARLVSQFNKLIQEFNDLMEHQRFAEAEVIAKQAVELDPNNPLSVTMRMRAAFARRVATIEKQQPATTAASPNAGEPWKPEPFAHESVIANAWKMLGLRFAPLTESERKQLLSKYQGGMKVTEVRADSPASQNMIRKDDILVGLHVWEITNFDNLQFALGHPHVMLHGSLKFYVVRGSDTLFGELKIVTPAMPMPSNIRIDPPRQPRSIALSDLPNKLVTEFDKLKLHIEVHRALIDTALEARGISVTDDEARQFLQVHADRDQIPYELFQQAMKHTPMGQQFLQATRQQLALVKHSGQTTEPTEQELRDAYQLAQAGRVASRQLSFADKAKANEVARELHANPQRFEEIAAKRGHPPNAFPGRTLIPTVPPNPIDEVLAQLEDGEISDVTPMGDQFVIYQRQQIVKPQGTFEQLKTQLRATLILNKTNEIGQREIEKLRKEYRLIVVPTGATSAASGSTKPNPAQTPLHSAEWESSALQTGPPAEAVAIVNGEVISYRDLVRWGSPLKELDGAVNLLLLKQAAKNAKFDIGSKEIDAEVLQQASKFKLPVDQWYSMLEKERGISRDHYREMVTFPMLVLRRLAGDDTNQQLTFLAGLRAAAKIELVDPAAKLLPVSVEATEPAPTTTVPDDEKPSE